MENVQRSGWAISQSVVLRGAGAALLVATGAIHLDLYLTGYRTIPTIGVLFLLQVIAAFGLAAAVLVVGNRLFAAAGAAFSAATLGGYVLSIWFGLFGFKEVRTTAGIVAGLIEVAAFGVLAFAAVAPGGGQAAVRVPLLDRFEAPVRGAVPAVAGLTVLALIVLGVAVATATGSAPAATSGSTVIKTTSIGGAKVLTNAKGFTLYWFAPDHRNKSVCYGACAAYWPPVTGTASVSGISGTFGTAKRTDGSSQITYNGRPLYTYVGDSAPGQAHGNNVNLNGGLWHEVTVSG